MFVNVKYNAHTPFLLNIRSIFKCYPLAFIYIYIFFFKILFIYLLREEKGGKKGGRETVMWETLIGCLSNVPDPGPNLQPRHVS